MRPRRASKPVTNPTPSVRSRRWPRTPRHSGRAALTRTLQTQARTMERMVYAALSMQAVTAAPRPGRRPGDRVAGRADRCIRSSPTPAADPAAAKLSRHSACTCGTVRRVPIPRITRTVDGAGNLRRSVAPGRIPAVPGIVALRTEEASLPLSRLGCIFCPVACRRAPTGSTAARPPPISCRWTPLRTTNDGAGA